MSAEGELAALVLAGSRSGEADPVARAAGVRAKCLAPVAGRPMVVRVVEALATTPRIGPILVVASPELGLERLAELVPHVATGRLLVRTPAESPAASLLEALDATGDRPMLVTTADHPLLTSTILGIFLRDAQASGADVAVGLAPAEAVLRTAPATRRTWWRFRDGRFSGANLFLLRGTAARPAILFWRRVEAERKRPWRIVRLFGLVDLVLYLSGLLTLSQAMARAARILGCGVAAVVIPIGEAAIDVDRPADLALAEALLAGRGHLGATS